MNDIAFGIFCQRYMIKGDRFVPGRLQAALALLERVRSYPTLNLADHTVRGGASVISHETLAKTAIERHGLSAVNKNSGRRSSNLPEWGQPLLDALGQAEFEPMKLQPLDLLQRRFAERLRAVLETDPFEVRVEGRTGEAVVADVLDQADQRDKAGAVAQYLVGAKLKLRYPTQHIPVRQFNQRDDDERRADFQIEEAAIEVALGTPDDKHIAQVRSILEESCYEVWLLVRARRVNAWKDELKDAITEGSLRQRMVLTAVEAFIGQNVTELGSFSADGKAKQLRALFALYNEHWVTVLGPPSIGIVAR